MLLLAVIFSPRYPGAYVTCWTPYQILAIIASFCPSCINVHIYMLSYFLCYANRLLRESEGERENERERERERVRESIKKLFSPQASTVRESVREGEMRGRKEGGREREGRS